MMNSLTKKAIKTLFTSAVVLGAVASPVAIFAQDYDALINDTQATINYLSEQQAALYSELALGYEALDALREEAELVLSNIAEDEDKIVELNAQIEELETLIAKRESLLADQARAVQANGGTTNYLNIVASAESISDFVGRLDIVRKMVTSNKDLLATQIDDKKAVEAKQAEVEEAKEEKIAKQVELEALKGALEEQQSNNEEVYAQLTSDLTLAAEHRDALVAEKQAYEEQQRIIAAQQAAAAAQAQAIAEAQAQAVAAEEAAQAALAQAEAQAQAAQEAAERAQVAEAALEVGEAEESVVVEEYVVENAVAEPTVVEEVTEVAEVETEAVVETYVEPVVEEVSSTESAEEAQAQAEAAAAQAEAARQEAERLAQAAQAEAQAQAEAAEVAAQEAAAAQEVAVAAQGNVSALLSNASQHLGTPYVWGGKNPGGFDCSGFVQYVFMQTYGVDVGGWTGAQESAGTRISVSEAQAGDLYFWGEPGGTYHVAIATGNGNYIHAAEPGTPLQYSAVNSYFMPSFALRVNVN